MECPSCNRHHSKPFRFCPDCGQRLSPPAGSALPQASPSPVASARLDEAEQAIRLLEQAFTRYDDQSFDEALGACQAALALDPESSTAHSLLGMIYERLGKTGDAVEEYRTVLRMNPDSIADQIKLESLTNGVGSSVSGAVGRLLAPRRRPAAIAGGTAAAVVLGLGVWAASRGGGVVPASSRRPAAHASTTPLPGPSLPPESTPSAPAPSSLEPKPGALAPPASSPSPPATTASASPPASGTARTQMSSLPSPPPSNAWPGGLRGQYPPAPPLDRAQREGPAASSARSGGGFTGRHGSGPGYLPPAPVSKVEKISPGQDEPPAAVPGASLPSMPVTLSSNPGNSSRDAAPVLPPAGAAAAPAPASPAAAPGAPAPPPSASINIQPLDDNQATASPQTVRPAAPARAPSLSQALIHQQMAAYYRRQGDDQAAFGEYRYARDLFRRVQERGGRDAAIAAQGEAAAEYGMSRLQGQ